MNSDKIIEVKRDVDALLVAQVDFINKHMIDIQKLVISLSTGSLVFSVSLLKDVPVVGKIYGNTDLMLSWFGFTAAIVSGLLNLIFGAWWFGNKLVIDRSKDKFSQSKLFKSLTEVCRCSRGVFEIVSLVMFIYAIVYLAKFAIGLMS